MMAAPARIRVLIFTISLGAGGAEAQALRVANNLDRARFDAAVAVLRGGGSYEPSLASHVRLHVLDGANLVSRAKSLRKLIRGLRPDVVCSFLEIPNLIAAWACRGLRPRPHLVACVQAPPTISWAGGGWRAALRALVSRYYRRAEQIIAISHGVAADIEQMAPGAQAHMVTIHNAGVDERVESGASMPLEPEDTLPRGPLLVACGRLVEQKGYPYLIDAFSIVRKEVPDAALWILGQGPDRPQIERQISDLSLDKSVRLLGFRDNPFRYMAAADLFVLSSVFEGFGNVVAEAMGCGTAVVSTDCPYGPSEIITDGVNGLLVPTRDPPALAAAILRVLRDPALKKRLAQEGKRRSKDFAASAITERYAEVFESLCGG